MITKEQMIAKEQIIEILTERYQKRDRESRLNREHFQTLFREGVKDYYPRLKKQYADQIIYGISFEIGDVIQKVYANHFKTYLYYNTEEEYQEKIKDCEEEEEEDKAYYRFEAWAEWDVTSAESVWFEQLQNYLMENSLYICCSASSYKNELEEAAVWYEEKEPEFEEAFDEECEQIRRWMAEVLETLRKEGFWAEQGSSELYVIPFGGECDIETEELIETYRLMDGGCHGTEYEDYLKSCE